MSISQLIFKKGNFIGEIELDVIVRESAKASAEVTSNPVENGADVNDHIIIKPMEFSMVGIVSDTKVKTLGGINTLETFTKQTSPSKDAWEALLALQVSKTPITLVQNLKTYDNVFIQDIEESQDKDSSNSLNFTANLKEIIFVGSAVLSAAQFADQDIADQAIANIEGGLK